MSWRKTFSQETAEKQKEADQAVIMSQIGYADMLNMNATAERIAKGHRRLQTENHLGYRMFGIEPPK